MNRARLKDLWGKYMERTGNGTNSTLNGRHGIEETGKSPHSSRGHMRKTFMDME